MDAILAMTLGVLGARAISLVAVGLRLHAQTLRDRRQQDTLVAMASHYSHHRMVDVEYMTGPGSSTRLRIMAGHEPERENDARTRTP